MFIIFNQKNTRVALKSNVKKYQTKQLQTNLSIKEDPFSIKSFANNGKYNKDWVQNGNNFNVNTSKKYKQYVHKRKYILLAVFN